MIVTFHGATLGISEYSIPAVDVAVVGDEVQFLTASGVERMDGDLSGASYVETGDLSLGGGAISNVARAYLVVRADAPMTLTATWGQGDSRSMQYPVPVRSGAGDRARTVPLGRGPRGVDWRLRLAAARGDWALKGVEVVVERTERAR